MLTWAFFWGMARMNTRSQMGWVIPMGCDVAIVYWIAQAFIRH